MFYTVLFKSIWLSFLLKEYARMIEIVCKDMFPVTIKQFNISRP